MTKTANSDSPDYTANLASMTPGSSFFVEGKAPGDLAFLYRIARRAGITISIRKVVSDEIYMVSGVRVWRVK